VLPDCAGTARESCGDIGRDRLDPLAQNIRRGHAIQTLQPCKGATFPIGADGPGIGLSQGQQGDLKGVNVTAGDGS